MSEEFLDDGRTLHLLGPNPGTQYTACMLDAGLMRRVEHDEERCATWCRTCFEIEHARRQQVSLTGVVTPL